MAHELFQFPSLPPTSSLKLTQNPRHLPPLSNPHPHSHPNMVSGTETVHYIHLHNSSQSVLEALRTQRREGLFCDVTVRIDKLEVPGHKVVFAAGSSFLRDQFILQQESREVQINMSQEAEVGRQLLLSCYTGRLVFPELELVHYLAVASEAEEVLSCVR